MHIRQLQQTLPNCFNPSCVLHSLLSTWLNAGTPSSNPIHLVDLSTMNLLGHRLYSQASIHRLSKAYAITPGISIVYKHSDDSC